jgi:hypothetical protein
MFCNLSLKWQLPRLINLVFSMRRPRRRRPDCSALLHEPYKKHTEVAELLLSHGARPVAKNVCGKTVCHYVAGAMATETTKSVKHCTEATKTSHMLFIKEVELTGLADTTKNGLRGPARGYIKPVVGDEWCICWTQNASCRSSQRTSDSLVWTVKTTPATTSVATAQMQMTQNAIFVRPVRSVCGKRCHCGWTTVARRPISSLRRVNRRGEKAEGVRFLDHFPLSIVV